MANFFIHRVTSVPGSPAANSFYIVDPATGDPNYCEIYVTGNAGSTIRRLPTEDDIVALILANAGGANAFQIADDITARDALSLAGNGNVLVLVLDASDDGTVSSGSAMYAFNDDGDTFTKVAEYESMDLTVNWSDIVGKPSSSAAAIDDAVADSHTHSNSTELDKIGEDGSGNLTYDSVQPKIAWDSVDW